MEITAADLVAEARSWVGTRWRHQGRRKKAIEPSVMRELGGVDCVGLVIELANTFELISPLDASRLAAELRPLGLTVATAPRFDITGYGREPDAEGVLLKKICDSMMRKATELRPGMAVLMNFGEAPRHMGILGDYRGGGLSLIHAFIEPGRCIEHRLDEVWKARIVQGYQLPGVELEGAASGILAR